MEDKEVLVLVPFGTKEEAQKAGRMLLREMLAYVVRVYDGVWQAWMENPEKLGEEEVVILQARTMKNKLEEMHKKIKEIHSWSVFCFEIVELEQVGEEVAC